MQPDLTLAAARQEPATTAAAPRGGPTDPSHDERLRRGILHTDVSRATAAALTLTFLLSIYAIPLSQIVRDKLKGQESPLLELFRHAPTQERLHEFEHELEENSDAKDAVQPHLQLWLSHYGRAGNKRAVIGADGWLYYKPGITFLSGPRFLDSQVIQEKERAARDDGTPLRADPRPAIFDFQQALATRGIRLVLFPVPDKAMLTPDKLHGRASSIGPVARNPDFAQFAREVESHGVLLFDPTPRELKVNEPERFLIQDTHWTPAYLQEVSGLLAQFVSRAVPLSAPAPALHRVAQTAERVGDLVDMLKLPEDQHAFLPQSVPLQQAQDAQGEPWAPDANAEVLLLGDSFTNVFTEDFMGWGSAAGLGPQLALELGRGVDVIAQNDSGAFATREALANELSGGQDRLAGKKVVVWEFASRELAVGNWKSIDWKAALAGVRP